MAKKSSSGLLPFLARFLGTQLGRAVAWKDNTFQPTENLPDPHQGRNLSNIYFTLKSEWVFYAPMEDVFSALADARTYPTWWRDVFLEVHPSVAGYEPQVGDKFILHAKGWLPLQQLYIILTIAETKAPKVLEMEVNGDIAGRIRWTLKERGHKTFVNQEYLLNTHAPLGFILKPAFSLKATRSYKWAIRRGQEGLHIYLAGQAAETITELTRARAEKKTQSS